MKKWMHTKQVGFLLTSQELELDSIFQANEYVRIGKDISQVQIMICLNTLCNSTLPGSK